MEREKIIKTFISLCEIKEDEDGRYFSTTLDNYTKFMDEYNVDFHDLWDSLDPEESLKYLY